MLVRTTSWQVYLLNLCLVILVGLFHVQVDMAGLLGFFNCCSLVILKTSGLVSVKPLAYYSPTPPLKGPIRLH